MKARRSVLGIILIIGMILSCAAASYATATKAPKFTTSKIADGEHGGEYDQEIAVTDNTTSKDIAINVSITDKASADLKALGLTLSYTSDGGLSLKSSKLTGTTAGYKFTVTATNQYEQKAGDGKWKSGKTTKDYTIKIKGKKPTLEGPEVESDLGEVANASGYALKDVRITPIVFSTDVCSPKVNITAKGLPSGLSMVAVNQPTSGEPAVTTFAVSGEPKVVGTFKVTFTAENADKKVASGKSSLNYTLTVLDSPDIEPKKFKAAATYGKAINEKFTIIGVTKEVPLTSAEAIVYVGTTPYSPDKVGLTIPLEEDDLKKMAINVKGTLKNIEPSFGTSKTTSVDVVFKLKSPAYASPKEIHLPLTINAIGPKITADSKKDATNTAKALTMGEKTQSIDIVAAGPGVISWDVGKLPPGIESAGPVVTSDDDGYYSKLELSGTPTATQKGFSVNIKAYNAAGSDTFALKFTVGGNDPVITMSPLVDSLDNSPLKSLAVNSDSIKVTLSVDIGPVQWKVDKLPKGVSVVMSPDKNAATSQIIEITGKPTEATKDGAVIKVTATDPNTKKKAEVELGGIKVYPKPTISTKKFKDITLGAEYSDPIKADGVTSYIVSTDLKDAKLPEGLSFDSGDDGVFKLYGTVNTIPTSGDKIFEEFNVILTGKGPGGTTSATKIPVKFKGSAPKFKTTKLDTDYTKAGSETNAIEITGTKPITFKAYIPKADAAKAGITLPAASKDGIVLTDTADAITGLKITSTDVDGGMTLTLGKEAGKGGSFKNLPVVIELNNGVGGNKTVSKTFKANMSGEGIVWYLNGVKVSDDFTSVNFTAGSLDAVSMSFVASGDAPMTVTVKPSGTTAGLKITTSADAHSVSIQALKSSEAKSTKVTMTAENGEGKVPLTITFNGQDKPKIQAPKASEKSKYSGGYLKEADMGKKFSYSVPLEKGTKPVKWYIHPNSPLKSADLKSSLDIEMNEDTGKLEGTPNNVTLSKDGKTYAPATVWVYAENGAGSSDIMSVDIGIRGGGAKLETKSITLTRGQKPDDDNKQLKAVDIEDGIVWTVEEKSGKKNLAAYIKGLDLVSKDGTISGDAQEANKGVSVPIKMDYFGAESKGSVKFIVYDPAPLIVSEDPGYIAITGVKADSKGKTTAAKTKTLKLTISDDFKATGTSKISWKATKPGDNRLSVKLAVDKSDKLGNKATVTVTLAKGKTVDTNDSNDVLPFEDEFEVTATNSGAVKDENSDTITIKIYVVSGDTVTVKADNSSKENETIGETAALKEDIVTDDELTAELGEGEVTIGAERTVGMLTAEQAKVLDEGRFVIAAILPEISATADGQYGFEIDLAENVKPGAKLYWFAFPKDAPDSEDDEIIDFFELDGKATEVVPEDHVVAAYPWLRAGVTYGPVIAVKAEDAEEGEAVTKGKLEEAAEEGAAK